MHDNLDGIESSKKYQMIKRLGGIFMEIFSKNLSSEILGNLMELKYEILDLKEKSKNRSLDPEYGELMDIIFQRLNFFLLESVHKQTSGIIREMIKDIYKVEYKKDDHSLIDCIFQLKDYPKIFLKKIYSETQYTLSELIKNPEEKEMKETSDLFTTYESNYPYDKDISLEALNQISSIGRMKVYEGFFLWFSEYFSLYETSMNVLMCDDDYIPITWKYYLAIMAVSTIRCDYLLKELEMQFLLKGGDEKWLINGLSEIPEKLKILEKINNILAHQPWKLKIQDLTDIHRKYESKGWHANELVQAVLILTNYHRLAAVVEAMRFNFLEFFEENNDEGILTNDEQKDSKIFKYVADENIKKIIINELEIINQSDKKVKNDMSMNHSRKTSEENLKLNNSFDKGFKVNNKEFLKHISSYCTVYLDFDSHSEEFFSYIEFNWLDHGAYILKNFYSNGIDAVNAEIEYITTISSNNIGGDSKKLDTAQYRHTICTYVEKIFGYVNESFDYSKTNKLLHRTHKQFIKNIACFPQKINKTDVGVLKVTFSTEEIYHIILLVSAAKMRLQLTYFSKQLYEIIKSIE